MCPRSSADKSPKRAGTSDKSPKRAGTADTRDSIRQAAYESFRDLGYHETSVDTICRGAGASKGSFYYHYPSKQECFIDILDSWTREVISEVQKQFEEATLDRHPFASLMAAFRRENTRGHLVVPLWLEFTVIARREPAIREVISRFYHRARLAIAEMLRAFTGDLITPEDLDGLSASIFGVYMGVVTQQLADPDHFDPNIASDAVLRVMGRLFERVDPSRFPTGGSVGGDAKGAPPAVQRLGDDDFATFVAPFGGAIRKCMADLRDLVHAQVPAAGERLVPGWHVLAFDMHGLFCYLKPHEEHVDVGFYHGAELADAQGILAGRGKHTRHVSVRPTQLRTTLLRALVKQAAALQAPPED